MDNLNKLKLQLQNQFQYPNQFNQFQNPYQFYKFQNPYQFYQFQKLQKFNQIQNKNQFNQIQNQNQFNQLKNLNQSNQIQNQNLFNQLQNLNQSNQIQNLNQSNQIQNLNQSNQFNKQNQFNQYQNQFQNQNNFNNIENENEPKKYHETKNWDLSYIKRAFDRTKEARLRERFYELVHDEEVYEVGSNALKDKIVGFFKKVFNMKESKNEDTIENHLKLIPYNQGTFEEKTILILVSGYFSSKSDHFEEWENLISVYEQKYHNPIIYFYNWPSSAVSLKKLVFNRKDFRDARERAKICGKILALMIMSQEFFNGFKINLSAFSLGNHVIKNAIKELEEFQRLDLINNVVFMAGATDIKCNFKWEHRLSAICGVVVNCFSDYDIALWYCKKITGKDTIGTKKLKFPNLKVKNILISSFHLLYRTDMNKLWKMFINYLKD